MNLALKFDGLVARPFSTRWRSPSNIAFVKYWGKKGHQIPANHSLSLTLKECYTETETFFTPSEEFKVELFLNGNLEEKFSQKIEKYIVSLSLPWLTKVSFRIETRNTFPHGTGIASSASGLSAFALCLTEYLYFLKGTEGNFFETASNLARLASGSACRSVYGGFTSWGEVSDDFASPVEVHPEMKNLRDTVLVVSSEEKAVSSTRGHGQMSEHYFAEARFKQARVNFDKMKRSLQAGDLETMGTILESEALSLHAMMLTSPEYYMLLKPQTLTAIQMIWSFRQETKLPLYFTLDAGPNLHLIYPEAHQDKIKTFINHELSPIAQKVIDDERGEGPVKC